MLGRTLHRLEIFLDEISRAVTLTFELQRFIFLNSGVAVRSLSMWPVTLATLEYTVFYASLFRS